MPVPLVAVVLHHPVVQVAHRVLVVAVQASAAVPVAPHQVVAQVQAVFLLWPELEALRLVSRTLLRER